MFLKDTFNIKIPKVYVARKTKGNMDSIATFEGRTLKELEEFFPKILTTRILLGTMAKVYDSMGILSPLLGSLRSSLRECSDVGGCKLWDIPIPEDIRMRFIGRMFEVDLVRNKTYSRTRSTEDAIPEDGTLYVFSDASSEMSQFVCYLSLSRKSGGWTCQFMGAKNHLARRSSTIPKRSLKQQHLQ